MMKLNGWKRIGIIASVVWILAAGVHTYDSEIDRANDYITSTFLNCESNWVGTGDAYEKHIDRCEKIENESLALALTSARLDGALVALIPVPLGWGFAYLILFLVRWVKRGFVRPL
jgi:hypothetical protein